MIVRHAAAVLATTWIAAAAPAQDGVAGELTTIDGRKVAGALTVAADGTVRAAPAQGEALVVGLADVLAIERGPGPAQRDEPPMRVWLRSGSILPARALDGAPAVEGRPGALSIRTMGGAEVVVPLTSVAALRCREPEPRTFSADRADPNLNLDYVFVVKDGNPDRFSVTIESIHDGRVHFDLRGTAYDYPLAGADGMAAIVFGQNTGFAPDRQGKPRVQVALRTGEHVEGKLLQLGTRLQVRLDEGAVLDVPAALLQRIDVLSDKLTWLATLRPDVEQVAAFDRAWPWTVDRSPAGPGLVLGGRTFERGLELVPRTRLTYAVGGRFDLFEATIGIDDRGGPQAHAIFRVLTDGKVAFESAPMTLGQSPVPIRVDLGKCQRLAIEVDFGKNFDLGDLCAFADARIVQQ